MEGEREMAVSEEKRNTEAAREELQRTKQVVTDVWPTAVSMLK